MLFLSEQENSQQNTSSNVHNLIAQLPATVTFHCHKSLASLWFYSPRIYMTFTELFSKVKNNYYNTLANDFTLKKTVLARLQ